MKNWYISIVVVLGMITMTPALQAQETEVMVRVKSKDAKFIGSSIGGAMVLIKNAETGEVLASGKTSGSTGDTELIMKQAHSRNQRLTDENTAGFLAQTGP